MKKFRRHDIKAILADPVKRRDFMVGAILTLQRREGKNTTRQQAEAAYDRVHKQLNGNLFDRWERQMIRLGLDGEIVGEKPRKEKES